MNKYLLLRDNKQSGPYTVPELIELGIKAYDLVWLDGKSAAWRYPSEVEDLKAYAPAVEEQPFDRFYKRPEPVPQQKPVQQQKPEHAAYVPKVEQQEVEVVPIVESAPRKKVYINFPVTAPAPKKVVTTQPVQQTPPAVATQPVSEGFAEQTFYKQASEVITSRHAPANKPSTDKRFVYAAVAACVVLVGLIAMLLVNNSSQQNRLNELNTIVRQIEEKNATEAAQATQVKNDQTSTPATPETSETIINPELLNLAQNESVPANAAAGKDQSASLPVAPTPVPSKKVERKPINADGVSFTERPVLRRADNEPSTKPAAEQEPVAAASSENLFKQVSVTPNKYKTGVLGGISNLQLQITNNSNRELHKVAVQIKYFGPEKKVVKTQTVYFENVSPNSQLTIDVPRSKRGVSIDYTITDIKS